MKNLRESTTNEKVRDYHKEFYRPENLWLIVAGKIEIPAVINALAPIEEKILSKGSRSTYNRAWQTPVPSLEESVSRDVTYPSDDEATGIVCIAWRGPKANKDIIDYYATLILMEYMTETSVSPLKAAFVENKDPFASE